MNCRRYGKRRGFMRHRRTRSELWLEDVGGLRRVQTSRGMSYKLGELYT